MDQRHGMKVVGLLLLAAACTLGAWAWGAEPTTQSVFRDYTSGRVRASAPLDPAKLERIKDGMTLGQIVEELGPVSWVGPGTGVLIWSFSDGRELRVWPHERNESEVINKRGTGGTGGQMSIHHPKIEQDPPRPATRPTASQPASAPATQATGDFRAFTGSWRRPAPLDSAMLDLIWIQDAVTLGQIVQVLGPGWMHPRSGMGIITWSFSDGRQLQVLSREFKATEVITKLGTGGGSHMWIEQQSKMEQDPPRPATRPTTSQPASTPSTQSD